MRLYRQILEPTEQSPWMRNKAQKREFQSSTLQQYQCYNSTIEMSALGDSDEGGSFCISRRRIDEAGPNSLPELQDVVRDAVMRGLGDQWSVWRN